MVASSLFAFKEKKRCTEHNKCLFFLINFLKWANKSLPASQVCLVQSSLIIIPTVPIRRITKGLATGVISSNNELHFYEKQSEQSSVRNISMEKIFE